MKANSAKKASPSVEKNTVRVRLLVGVETKAATLARETGLKQPDIIAMAAAEGMPLLRNKLKSLIAS